MRKEENVGYKLRLLHNFIQKHMEYKKEKNVYDTGDLTRMQQFIIGFLDYNSEREVYQKDLEAEFAISRATASNMLSVMERKGLIKREAVAHDARLKKLVLTESAKKRQQQIKHDILEMETLLTAGFSEDDKKNLHRYLDKMIQNMAEEDGDITTICCGRKKKQI